MMVNVTKQQICHKLCSNLASLLPVILVLVFLFSIFFFFSVSESSPSLLTLLITLLSTLFLITLAKKKGSLHENFVQDKMQKSELQLSLRDITNTTTQPSETAQKQAEAHSNSSFPLDCESSNIMDSELCAEKYEQQADPESDTLLPSDSESSTSSTMDESIEIHHNRDQNLHISDSQHLHISDSQHLHIFDSLAFDDEEEEEEDGLIEIKLPNNHFLEFFSESIFKQQGLTELLAEINEMNEDENLIEIDISKGSTKHQDLRLKKELVF